MADEFIVQGTILEIKKTGGDYKNKEGRWTRYSFKIADHNTGRTLTYGWFSDKGGDIDQGMHYEFKCNEETNPDPDKPTFRNILELVGSIPAPKPGTKAAAASVNGGRDQGEFRRSKEELRFGDALGLAVQVVGYQFHQGTEWDDDTPANIRRVIVEQAEFFNELLKSVDPEPEPEQEPPADPPKTTTKAKATKAKAPADNAPFNDGDSPEATEPTGTMSEDDLKAVLGGIGMGKETFEVEVLGTDWETFKSRGGTPLVAYNRLKTWQEKQPGGVTV